MKVRVNNLTFTYPSGVEALKGISLEFDAGEVIAIVGENGAGKSTLVKHFNGLLRPDSGEVYIGDWDTAEHSTAQLAGRVGYLFQNPDEQLFERSVRREVAFGPRNLGLQENEVERRVAKALEVVGLADEIDSNPYDLQYVERKLLALAATLAMETPILILDEPTIGQDAARQAQIGKIVDQLNKEERTVVLISHDLDFCAEHAERVVVMLDGEVIDDGPAGEVLTHGTKLEQAAVKAPQLVRLAQELGMQEKPLKVSEFVTAYADWKRG